MTRLLIASLAAALGIGAAVWFSPVWGQTCHAFDDVDAALRGQFAERTIILAITRDGVAFLFYGNPDTETWTLVMLNGPCAQVMGEGIGYEEIPAFAGEES